MSKSERVDSMHTQVAIMQAAQREIVPPLLLSGEERRFFDIVVSTKLEWSPVDLLQACNLARQMCSLEVNQSILNKEGLMLDTLNGKVINPLHRVVERQLRLVLSLARSLNIHSAATSGRARDQVQKNRALSAALHTMEMLDDLDDLEQLIARKID